MAEPFGEILSSSITEMVAACWQDQDGGLPSDGGLLPRFGSFVRVDSKEQGLDIFAVVFDVVTGPRDSLHKPAALRLSRDQLRSQQPQIFSLLQTETHCATVGYRHQGRYHCGLPPLPPMVHDFVFKATAEEVVAITEGLEFVRFVSRITSVPNDELVVAAITEAYAARGNDYSFLVQAGQSLAQSFGSDYDRLTAALRKLRPQTAGI